MWRRRGVVRPRRGLWRVPTLHRASVSSAPALRRVGSRRRHARRRNARRRNARRGPRHGHAARLHDVCGLLSGLRMHRGSLRVRRARDALLRRRHSLRGRYDLRSRVDDVWRMRRVRSVLLRGHGMHRTGPRLRHVRPLCGVRRGSTAMLRRGELPRGNDLRLRVLSRRLRRPGSAVLRFDALRDGPHVRRRRVHVTHSSAPVAMRSRTSSGEL